MFLFNFVEGLPLEILMSNQSVFRFLCSSIPTTTFGNLMVGACNPLEVYEYSHVYALNTCRSHQAPKMPRTRQKNYAYSHPTHL